EQNGALAGIHQFGGLLGERKLGLFQGVARRVVAADDIAAVVDMLFAGVVPGQVRQRLADELRALARAGTTMIADDTGITGEAEQGDPRRCTVSQWLDALVPADAVGFRVDTPPPDRHIDGVAHVHSPAKTRWRRRPGCTA